MRATEGKKEASKKKIKIIRIFTYLQLMSQLSNLQMSLHSLIAGQLLKFKRQNPQTVVNKLF